MALIGNVIGYLGADAKETSKGYYFNVSSKGLDFKTGESETTWVCCFVNYKNPTMMERLKKGTLVAVWGDLRFSLPENADQIPGVSITLTVDKIIPLSAKKES